MQYVNKRTNQSTKDEEMFRKVNVRSKEYKIYTCTDSFGDQVITIYCDNVRISCEVRLEGDWVTDWVTYVESVI